MPKVSIVCLIYKSTDWLQFVYDQIVKHTNLTDNEFYFVANDACPEVLGYLKDHDIPHCIHNNTEEQKKEWYINNVYRAYNTGGKMAKGEYIVFINSDMAFTPGWLDKLMDKIDNNKVVCSRLVERGVMRSGLYGIEKYFGSFPRDYNEESFIAYSSVVAEDKLMPGGLYMPILIKTEHFNQIGMYPEGNIVRGSDMYNPIYAIPGQQCMTGDRVLVAKLKNIGVLHWTNFNSIVYHFQEGEKRSS